VARWLEASLAVTVDACSWWSTADRGGPMSAFRACAETSMWDSAPLPEPRRGRQEGRCATLTVPVDDADPGRGSLDVARIQVRPAGQHDRIGSLVLNPAGAGLSGLGYMPVWASWPPDTLLARFDVVTLGPRGKAFERSPCVAEHVTLYLVELRIPGGQAC
jgi:hypothetical protein